MSQQALELLGSFLFGLVVGGFGAFGYIIMREMDAHEKELDHQESHNKSIDELLDYLKSETDASKKVRVKKVKPEHPGMTSFEVKRLDDDIKPTPKGD